MIAVVEDRWLSVGLLPELWSTMRMRSHALQAALNVAALLGAQIQRLSAELAVERETVKRLERIIQVLTREREKLRQSSGSGNIRPIKRSAR